jgi:3-hydroxybutyryl-CoA dehydrogenase
MTFSSVFVAGAGLMGSGIAYLIASQTDATVTVYDIIPQALEKSRASVQSIGKKSIEKGFITAPQFDSVISRIEYTGKLQDASTAQLVVEAVAEDLKIKQDLFAALDKIVPGSTIFASNTSSLPISSLALVTQRQTQFIGMHFFSPAYIMKLVELIPGKNTSVETVEKIRQFAEALGKVIICSKDLPGFITTRLGMVLINEAAFALMEELSSAREIDLGMTLGYNHPMGPLALADFVGLDICLHILDTMYEGFADPKYRACPLIRQLVEAGHLGKKTGKGFYEYQPG